MTALALRERVIRRQRGCVPSAYTAANCLPVASRSRAIKDVAASDARQTSSAVPLGNRAGHNPRWRSQLRHEITRWGRVVSRMGPGTWESGGRRPDSALSLSDPFSIRLLKRGPRPDIARRATSTYCAHPNHASY